MLKELLDLGDLGLGKLIYLLIDFIYFNYNKVDFLVQKQHQHIQWLEHRKFIY